MRIDRALRAYASEMHLSQAEICRRAGLDSKNASGHVSMLFTNTVQKPSVPFLYLIVHKGLRISMDAFLERAVFLDHGRILSDDEPDDDEGKHTGAASQGA